VPELSRSQLLVYGAIAVAVLLIGARWIRSSGGASADGAQVSFAADSSHEGQGTRDVVVHVAGDVRRPGVYRLPAGSRVTDAVRRAGGFGGGANQDAINLAARLSDGQQVVVPGRGTIAASSAPGGQTGPISLGSATAEQLDGIEGIGSRDGPEDHRVPRSARRLSSINQLDQVDGIGPSTMQTLRAGLQP